MAIFTYLLYSGCKNKLATNLILNIITVQRIPWEMLIKIGQNAQSRSGNRPNTKSKGYPVVRLMKL